MFALSFFCHHTRHHEMTVLTKEFSFTPPGSLIFWALFLFNYIAWRSVFFYFQVCKLQFYLSIIIVRLWIIFICGAVFVSFFPRYSSQITTQDNGTQKWIYAGNAKGRTVSRWSAKNSVFLLQSTFLCRKLKFFCLTGKYDKKLHLVTNFIGSVSRCWLESLETLLRRVYFRIQKWMLANIVGDVYSVASSMMSKVNTVNLFRAINFHKPCGSLTLYVIITEAL